MDRADGQPPCKRCKSPYVLEEDIDFELDGGVPPGVPEDAGLGDDAPTGVGNVIPAWDTLMGGLRQMVTEAVDAALGQRPPAPALVSRVVPAPTCPLVPAGVPSGTELPPLPPKLMDAIARGEFVNFDVIYNVIVDGDTSGGEPSPVSLALTTPPGEADATFHLMSRGPARRRVSTLQTWAVAWANFLEVAAHFRPAWVTVYLCYQTMIFNFATLYPPGDWSRYDVLFRTAAARQPHLRWDRQDERLFALCLRGRGSVRPSMTGALSSGVPQRCYTCSAVGHIARECPSSGRLSGPSVRRSPPLMRPPAPVRGRGWCRNFNSGVSHPGAQCPWRHGCDVCGQAHPRFECPSNR